MYDDYYRQTTQRVGKPIKEIWGLLLKNFFKMAPYNTEKGQGRSSMPVKTQFYKIWKKRGWRDEGSSDLAGPAIEDGHADAVSSNLP